MEHHDTFTADATTTTPATSPGHCHHRIDLESAYRIDPHTGKGAGHGKARMFHEGELIGESRQPAFDAARYLLAKGLALPSDKLATYRDGKPCLFTTVGRAAKLAVRETGKSGPQIAAYRGDEEETKERLKALRDYATAHQPPLSGRETEAQVTAR